ncbi:hypothetical protein [Dactylococcopsis salina]|nr:hypothetical protein [Dactylococcopsis salina]
MIALDKKDWEQEEKVPVIEALNEQFGQVSEPKTLIQESETFFTLLPSYLKIIEYVLYFRLSVLGDEKTLPKLFLDQIFSSVVKLAIIS